MALGTSVIGAAVEDWARQIGKENVSSTEAELRRAETATYATSQHIPVILRPGSREDVQACLDVANRLRIPIYPVSTGKNWGYGSQTPPVDGCALMHLGRMNRILDFSEELAYVTVEPGVTQRQLFDFLRERKSKLWMDATGSSPDCSLIGNTMERGFGHTPYGDHFAHVCGFEVVLPDGTILETGGARFSGSRTAAVNRWGAGPALDGLFAQSNLGVVTRMTIWLMPQPDAFAAFFFVSNDPNGLPALIDAFRPLRLNDVVRSSVHVANDYKVLGGLRQYPWDEMKGKTPMSAEVMEHFRKDLTFGFWNASGGLYGTPAQIKEAKRLLKAAVAPLGGKLKFVDEKMLALARRFSRPFKLVSGVDLGRMADLAEPVIGLMRGVPTKHALASAYWRKRSAPPSDPDPDRDRCGLLWYAPVAPANGREVERLVGLASETMLTGGFEPAISLTLISPRAVNCVISLTYDREVAGEDERALVCYRTLVSRCEAAGYYPYRLGTVSMPGDGSSAHAQVLSRIRKALDPNGILAPGRYES